MKRNYVELLLIGNLPLTESNPPSSQKEGLAEPEKGTLALQVQMMLHMPLYVETQ